MQKIDKFDDSLPNGRYLTSLTKEDFQAYCVSQGYSYSSYEYNYSGPSKEVTADKYTEICLTFRWFEDKGLSWFSIMRWNHEKHNWEKGYAKQD